VEPPVQITALDPPASPARVNPPAREAFRIGLVQERWHPDPEDHQSVLADGIRLAAVRAPAWSAFRS
jgi:N-carbamoylputrescine amidase